jgi:hypothetical protein
MSWSERLAALPPGRLVAATGFAVICGFVGVAVAVGTGSVPVAVAGYVLILGAGLLPAVADWCQANAAVEAIRRQYKEGTAVDAPQRGVESQTPAREEAEARIKAYYARLAWEPDTGPGRFPERLSVEAQLGRERLH